MEKLNVKPVPARLYKYMPFSTQTLQNLKKQIIWFGAPAAFNDPYDCAITPKVLRPTDDEVARYIRDFEKTASPDVMRHKVSFEEVRTTMHRATQASVESTLRKVLTERGVACFSERPDDLLMWSHYGGIYEGICLEFDTRFAPFEKVRSVQYVDAMPEIATSTLLGLADDDGGSDVIVDLFWTKSRSWEHENEWRMLHDVAGTAFGYPDEALTGVYFGPDIDYTSVEIVCLILKGQNPKVQFYSGRRSTDAFLVSFTPFTYTDYLTAKAKGLRTENDPLQTWPIQSIGAPQGQNRRP